jgi:1,4-dihydroxy-2-naphthoate octaprenyltransferase
VATLSRMPASAYLLGLPTGLLITNVLIIDDIRDHAFDREKGWRTTPVRFGVAVSRAEFLLFATVAYCLPVWFCFGLNFGYLVLLPLLTLPVAARLVRTVLTERRREALIPMTPRASFLALGYSGLLALGIALS